LFSLSSLSPHLLHLHLCVPVIGYLQTRRRDGDERQRERERDWVMNGELYSFIMGTPQVFIPDLFSDSGKKRGNYFHLLMEKLFS